MYAGRLNFDLARSQQALRALLKPAAGAVVNHHVPRTVDDEDDFDALDESAGLGSKPKQKDEGEEFGAVLSRKSKASTDRLLEQLLGSKAAKSKRKELDAPKSALQSHKPAFKQTGKQRQPENDSDDEGGRAAAFTSRKAQRNAQPATKPSNADSVVGGADSHTEHDDKASSVDDQRAHANSIDTQSSTPERQSAKRKAVRGYLDELLEAKAQKKKKKKT